MKLKGRETWNKGLTKETDERVRKNAETFRGKNHHLWRKPPWNKGTKGICKPNRTSYKKGHKHSPEIEQKRIKNIHKSPNNPERKVIDIIKKHHLPFKYVGSGDIIIDGKNPDFIDKIKRKKIIEVFGRVFHTPKIVLRKFKRSLPYNQTEEGTIKHYNNQGYDCLVVWEDEINNEQQLVERIKCLIVDGKNGQSQN